MKIGIVNTYGVLEKELALYGEVHKVNSLEDLESVDGIYLSWLKTTSSDVKALLLQTEIVEATVKAKKKLVVFDPHLDLDKKAISWLKKQNSVVFEPVLKPRTGVNYLPFPLTIEEPPFSETCYKEKSVDLGLVGDFKAMEAGYTKYFMKFEVDHPQYKLKLSGDYPDFKSTILLGTKFDYANGYLPDLTPMLENLCIPMLPAEHRFYWPLFRDTILHSPDDISFILKNLDLTYYGLICSIHGAMREYYPEMMANRVAKRIASIMEEK